MLTTVGVSTISQTGLLGAAFGNARATCSRRPCWPWIPLLPGSRRIKKMSKGAFLTCDDRVGHGSSTSHSYVNMSRKTTRMASALVGRMCHGERYFSRPRRPFPSTSIMQKSQPHPRPWPQGRIILRERGQRKSVG